MKKKSICFVVAIPSTAHSFLRDHIKALSKDYDVYLAGNIDKKEDVDGLDLNGWFKIDIKRSVSLLNDFKAIWQAWKLFNRMKFDAVHSVTPKAGLVCAVAGKIAGIKRRVHIYTGQVWATRKGIMRWMLKSIDKLIARLDNYILVDGKSQRSFLEEEGVLKRGGAIVFGSGSISGVNVSRFVPDNNERYNVRREIGINDDSIVFVFLGRLNKDKGISELLSAFQKLSSEKDNVFLLLIGRDEDGYMGKLLDYPNIKEKENLYFYGHTREPEKVLNAGDVFVLPTYREGFGSSVLEAACIGLPCICSDAYGVQDAFIENETGLKCKVGDVISLYQCMKEMAEKPGLIKQMGENSRKRVLNEFPSEIITRYWVNFYKEMFN